MARMVSSEARNPPTLTMPVALPRRSGGLKVRAKSKPIIEPGPPRASPSTSRTSTHSGARPGQASTSVQTVTVTVRMPSTSHDRRSGWRDTRCPKTGPQAIPVTTKTVSRALAVAGVSPSPETRNG